jgi:tetratricopeptide (TPR) repeat protein
LVAGRLLGHAMSGLLRFLSLIIALTGICARPAAAEPDPDWQACSIPNPKAASEIAAKIAGCTRVLDRNGNQTTHRRAIALANRGLAYQNKGDVDRAIADFSEAIRIDPEFPNWRYARGIEYANKGEFDRAVADFSEAIRLRPNTAGYLKDRGRAYERIGDLAKALADLQAAQSLEPNVPDTGEAIRRIEGKLVATAQKPPASTQEASQVYRMVIQGYPEAGGKCLSITGSRPVDGARLQTSECQPAASQVFIYDQSTQLLTIGGLCVELRGQDKEAAAVSLGNCAGDPNQRWRVVASGEYYRFFGMNDRCLDNANLSAIQKCSAQSTTQLWVLMEAP